MPVKASVVLNVEQEQMCGYANFPLHERDSADTFFLR
jgi:hypothetical protein